MRDQHIPRASIHSSSSSVPSTSSAPSLSGLRVGGPNTPTSPSMDSATTLNATAAASRNLQFKEVLEYDNVERLRIVPYHDGKFVKGLATFYQSKVDQLVVFGGSFLSIMDHAKMIETIHYGMHGGGSKKVHQKRDFSNYISYGWDLSSRDSHGYNDRSIHVALQSSDVALTLYMGKVLQKFFNGGVDVPLPTAFEETHRKKNPNSTREEWVEPCAKDAFGFLKSIEDWRQTQPASEGGTMVQPSPSDMTRIWTTVEEMEAMRTKIEELAQHCAKFIKFEALVKKHMPQVFGDGEDSESDD
ncbi:hypothetical protein FXO38_19477 [Capsicum annuum]|nr:hypothetical protein FXO38_19477 [Capsicum annuum]KAF3661674.1 hypothetical protein FXO37_12811 [Capsicum annuum]